MKFQLIIGPAQLRFALLARGRGPSLMIVHMHVAWRDARFGFDIRRLAPLPEPFASPASTYCSWVR